MIGGIGVGMASVVSPMYITEFSPAEKRGRMVAYYQLAITIGILLAYFSNALIVSVKGSQWFFMKEIWRPMFFAMTLPSIAFIILLIKIPESPRWLVAAKKNEEAKVVLNTIRTPEAAAKELRDITEASLKDNLVKISLFSKELRLPMIIGVVLAILQQFCGINAIIYYGPKIFETAGIASNNAIIFQVIIGTVNLLFTFVAIRWADKYGRKFLLVSGLSGIILSLILCGILFYTNSPHNILLLILIIIFIACFAFSLGPVTWILINEIFPTEVRAKAVSVCTLALWIAVWMVGQFFPFLLEHAGPAITFWVFAGFSIINLFFSLNVVKETKGRTLEEMQEVFIAPH